MALNVHYKVLIFDGTIFGYLKERMELHLDCRMEFGKSFKLDLYLRRVVLRLR